MYVDTYVEYHVHVHVILRSLCLLGRYRGVAFTGSRTTHIRSLGIQLSNLLLSFGLGQDEYMWTTLFYITFTRQFFLLCGDGHLTRTAS